jgi:hypothetical protein
MARAKFVDAGCLAPGNKWMNPGRNYFTVPGKRGQLDK